MQSSTLWYDNFPTPPISQLGTDNLEKVELPPHNLLQDSRIVYKLSQLLFSLPLSISIYSG